MSHKFHSLLLCYIEKINLFYCAKMLLCLHAFVPSGKDFKACYRSVMWGGPELFWTFLIFYFYLSLNIVLKNKLKIALTFTSKFNIYAIWILEYTHEMMGISHTASLAISMSNLKIWPRKVRLQSSTVYIICIKYK